MLNLQTSKEINLEFIGLMFVIGLFIYLGSAAVAVVIVALGIIGILTMIPDEKKPLIKPMLGGFLIIGSLLLLISI